MILLNENKALNQSFKLISKSEEDCREFASSALFRINYVQIVKWEKQSGIKRLQYFRII